MSESPSRNTVTVRIAGEEYSLRSAVEPEYTRRCARFVDERVREIRDLSGVVENHRAVILAALSITDRLFQSREELDRLRSEMASQSEDLARRVEEALESPSRR